MKVTDLPNEVTQYLLHIEGWESLVSDDVANILKKIAHNEQLGRTELGTDVTPSEVAAIWSVRYQTDINPRYVREVKRKGRIEPSKEWGKGSGYRCLYKVRTILPIEVGHQRGRPAKKQVVQS